MSDIQESSEARRVLLEKYLRGEFSQEKKTGNPATSVPKATLSIAREQVIPIQTRGRKRPFFFLHGDWTSDAIFCFRLAHLLGPDYPFYILTPYDFNGLDELPTIEEMAAAHIKSILAVQPRGPYMIGGFCNGGLTAYEMARQLHTQGESVDQLILMDAIPPRTQRTCAVLRHLGRLTKSSQSKQLNWYLHMEHAFRYMLDKHSDDFEQISKSDNRIRAYFPPVETLRKEYPAMFTWATSNYQPAFYPGKVTLFWDEMEPFRRKWWHDWAKEQDQEVEERIIPGSHSTCKTENIQGMAQHLRECLDQVTTVAS